MTMLNTDTLGAARRYKLAREVSGMKQEDLARQIGVARSTIGEWERGSTEPSASKLVRLAQVTNQPLSWFAEGLEIDLCATRDSNPQPSVSEASPAFWTRDRSLNLASLWRQLDVDVVSPFDRRS